LGQRPDTPAETPGRQRRDGAKLLDADGACFFENPRGKFLRENLFDLHCIFPARVVQ